MGSMVQSVQGFVGGDTGAKAPGGNFSNLNQLSDMNNAMSNAGAQNSLNQFAMGNVGANQAMSGDYGLSPDQQAGFNNQLATGATTGSQYATQQVQNNPLLQQGLQAQAGQMQTGQGLENSQIGQLNQLQNQGFQLQPQDQTQYGQMSGNIARQFGQQGNQTANDLASRGLSSSGAAGAAFSGLAGNQNEMLGQAQQQIAQQRFQNTMNQIGQTQQFIGNLNSQNNQAANQYSNTGASDVNQQYGRQLQGAQNQQQGLFEGGQLQDQQNSYNLQAAGFNQSNKPENFMDQSIANSNTASHAFAQGLGSMGTGMLSGGGGMMGGGAAGAVGAAGGGGGTGVPAAQNQGMT